MVDTMWSGTIHACSVRTVRFAARPIGSFHRTSISETMTPVPRMKSTAASRYKLKSGPRTRSNQEWASILTPTVSSTNARAGCR